MISICNDKLKCFRIPVLVGLILMTTVFSYANTNVSAGKEKYANITPVSPLEGEALEFGNRIAWQNFEKEDVKFFIIQRSSDGKDFKPLAMVKKIDGQDSYSFIDKKAENKQWFYRIMQVNRSGDGYFTESILLK